MGICRCPGGWSTASFSKVAQRTRPKPLIHVNAGGSRKTGDSKTRSTSLHTQSPNPWCNATWRRLRSTWARHSLPISGTRMRGRLSSCWLTEDMPMGPHPKSRQTCFSGGSISWYLTCISGLPQTRKRQWPTSQSTCSSRWMTSNSLLAITSWSHTMASWPFGGVSRWRSNLDLTPYPEDREVT